MTYTPNPERRPIPRDVVAFAVTGAALVALFFFAPVITRAAMADAPTAATCATDSECAMTPECRADSQCDGGPQK